MITRAWFSLFLKLFLSFFLSLLNRCQYVCISFLIISFFVVQMLNYVHKLNKITIKLILKNETRNRPALYTNMYVYSDLNFFAAGLFRNA